MDTCLFVLDVVLITWSAHRLARHVCKDARHSEVATFGTAVGVAVTMFVLIVLAVCRGFTPWLTAASFVAIAVVAWRLVPSDEPSSVAPWFGIERAHLPITVPIVGFLPLLSRSMATPPRAWDALTYHLPRAVNWVQDAGFVPHIGPNAARYYEFFSPGGDLLFAFTFLAGRSDALLFVVYAGTFSAVLLGTYALARALGARTLDASLAAAVVGTMPCVVQFAASAYVDNALLALTLLSLALLVRAFDQAAPEHLVAASLITAGAAAATKGSGVILLAVSFVAGLVLARKGRVGGRFLAAACALAAVPTILWAGFVAHHTGSPTYPFGIRLGGVELTRGNELLRHTLEGAPGYVAQGDPSFAPFIIELFFGSRAVGWPHLNFGLGGGLAMVLGFGALVRKRTTPRWLLGVLVALAVAPLLSVFAPSATAFRSAWSPMTGRLLSLLVAIPACFAASGTTRVGRVGLALAVLIALPNLRPAGLAWDEVAHGAQSIAIAFAWATAGISVAAAPLRASIRGILLGLFVLASPVTLRSLEIAREVHRYESYADLAAVRTFEFQPVLIGRQDLLWRQLDQSRPERIAYSAGFVPPGHSQFRYPLYGSHLQNRVEFVPATRNGVIQDATERRAHPLPMDADAYADRLLRLGITAVVFIAPPGPDARLALANPDRFVLRFAARSGEYVVFRPMPRVHPDTPSTPRGGEHTATDDASAGSR